MMGRLDKEEKLHQIETSIYNTYRSKTPKSKKIFDRAVQYMPGGVSGNVKFFDPYPVYMKGGNGSKQYDVDGNAYIDCHLSNGPLLLGHSPKNIMASVKTELERGLLLYNPDYIIECAELLKRVIPCAERVRFANSGSEATMLAVKLARAFTNKNKIIKFYGHYHGQCDQFQVGARNTSNQPMTLGITAESLANTIVLKFNDLEVVKRKLDEDNDIAGIILDPQGSMGGIFPADLEFLKGLRALSQERGVVLIFDEVITGFRIALGGAQDYFGVTPDIATFAKALSSGGRFAAVAGRKDILETVMPRPDGKKVFHSGTCNDEIVGVVSAISTIKEYIKLNDKGEYQQLHQKCRSLKTGIEKAFSEKGIPCRINIFGPSLKVFFTDLEPNFEAYSQLETGLRRLFYLALMCEGVLLAWPSAGTTFLSFEHTKEDIEKIIEGVQVVLEKYELNTLF